MNNKIKPFFREVIPEILSGNFERSQELAEKLIQYTWSYSNLFPLLKSDKSFLHNLIRPFEQSDEMKLGELVHKLALGESLEGYF